MSGTGDLWTVLLEADDAHEVLEAFAIADEPLTAEVEVRRDVDWDAYGESGTGVLTERVRIVAMTEDVLRARLRGAEVVVNVESKHRSRLLPSEVDAIARALFGGAS